MSKKQKEKNKLQEVFGDNPEFKRLFFFVFYIVFFIFLVVLLRSAYKTNNESLTRYNSGYKHNFTLDALNKNNYAFTYKVFKNDQIIIFEGSKYNNTSSFLMSGEVASSYKFNGKNYSKKNENTLLYEDVVNPMEFDRFLDSTILPLIFTRSTYVSRTEYLNSEEKDYNYDIATSTLIKLVDHIETDLDGINKVVAHVNEKGELYRLDMDVTNYFKYFDSSIYYYTLELNFSKFGEVEGE